MELGWRFCYALVHFWCRRGYWSEGRRWIEGVVALPGALTAAVPVALRAEVLLSAGRLAWGQGDRVRDRSLEEDGLVLCRAAGDPAYIGPVLLHLEQREVDPVRSQALLEEGLAHCRAAGDTRWTAEALHRLSLLAALRGDQAQEQAYLEEGLALVKQIEDIEERAQVLLDVGCAQRQWGPDTRDRAAALLEESLRLFRNLEDKDGSAGALQNLGAALRDQGHYERARALIEESVALFREMGHRLLLAWELYELGETLLLQGDDLSARAREEECLALFREIGCRDLFPMPLLHMAHIAKHQGDYGRAFAYLEESLTLMREAWGYDPGLTRFLIGLAGIAGWQGQPERAARLFGAVLPSAEATAPHGEPFYPAHQRELDRDLAAARAQLDDTTWEAAWAEGQAMSLEQAVAYALEGTG